MKNNQDNKEQFDFKAFESEAILGLQSGKPWLGSGGVLNLLNSVIVLGKAKPRELRNP